MLRALQLIVVLALLYFLARGAVLGMHAGKIRLRGGMIIERRKKPLLFWASIAAQIFFFLVIVSVYVLSLDRPMFGI